MSTEDFLFPLSPKGNSEQRLVDDSMECAAAELLAGTQDSLFNDSLEERHIHEKSTKSAQSDPFLEKSPGDKKEQSLNDSLDLDATQLPFDEELTAFSHVPDAGSIKEASGVTKPTSHSNTVGFQLAENVQASLTNVEKANTTAVDEHHQQVPQNQTQVDDDTCVNASTTCGLSPVSTDSATSKSSTASKVVPSFGRRKSTKNESSTTNTRALNAEVKLSTEKQVPVVLDEKSTNKDEAMKVGVDLDQSKETENPEEDQCVPESDGKSEKLQLQKPKFATSSASKKKHASKSTTGSASGDDQTETQEVENTTGNTKPKKSALSESGKKTKVIAQEKKKKEREEKKKEMERKKLEREQKKRETDEKKAEKERLKKERQLELERKKAEREQKKIEQQLKKTEKMNKTEGRKNSKKTIKQSGKENESSNNEATTSESESVPSNIKISETGDTSPPAPMNTDSTTPETEQQVSESVTMESTEDQCDTTTGRKKSGENTLMCGPTPPEENAALPDNTSALQSGNLPNSKTAESVNTRLDDSPCEGVIASEVSMSVVEGQSAALPVENAAVEECDARLKNRELHAELKENGVEKKLVDDDAESINIKDTEECDENLKNPEQALEEAGVEEKSVNDFSEPDHVSKGREKQKEVAAQGSSVKGDKIKIVFGQSGNKTKVTQDAAKSSVSGKSGKNSSTATTKTKHVGLSSISDVKKLLKKGSNTSTKISSKNQKSKPKKRTRLREDDSKAKRSRPSNYTGPVWVQCERASCKKWRQLRNCRDPLSLPDSWTCSMNTDPERSSCSATEEHWSEDMGDSQEYVESPFIPGSLVWAKMDGYPWWPAMVEEDPNEETYYEMGDRSTTSVPVKYHVVFFDTPVTRGWVSSFHIEPYSEDQDHTTTTTVSDKLRRGLKEAKKQAKRALDMTVTERLTECSFAKRFRRMASRKRKTEEKDTFNSRVKLAKTSTSCVQGRKSSRLGRAAPVEGEGEGVGERGCEEVGEGGRV